MKTLSKKGIYGRIIILWSAMILVIASCGGQGKGDSGTEKPRIDIHTAVISGDLDVVKQHLEAGTNINERDPFGGSSPLISASLFGQTDIVKVLLDEGADVNFQNNDGSTALHVAAFFCRPEIVKILLDKGADKSVRNNYQTTAYESVVAPFDQVRGAYDVMGKMLAPTGLKLDYDQLQKTRPVIAEMLM